MVSETKALSDTQLQRHDSLSSDVPLKLISSINSHRNSSEHFIRSIHSNENLIQTHFPIAKIPTGILGISSSYRLPTVPKQAGTFLHRLVNKFLSLTNINPKKNNRIRVKQRQRNTRESADGSTFVNIATKKRKHQRLKTLVKKNRIVQQCQICQRNQNYLPNLPTDSLECFSPVTLNNNPLNHPSIPIRKPSLSSSQCQTIVSAVQLIFDTLLSNYK